jgi:abortive infection bacteriophage resistance protein
MITDHRKEHYHKQVLPTQDQISLMTSRGLIVSNPERLKEYLETIGYYRLSGYFHHFYQGETDQQGHSFASGTTFDDVFDLYKKDEKLRLILLKVLHRIEVALKAIINSTVEAKTNDSLWYTKAQWFKNDFTYSRLFPSIEKDLKLGKRPTLQYIAILKNSCTLEV